MIPLYGFLELDTIGLLIMAYPEDTINVLIKKLQDSAAIRVRPKMAMKLYYKNQLMDPEATVNEIGFRPLDHFFVGTHPHV